MKVLIFNDTSNEHHAGCRELMKNLRALCSEHGLKVLASYSREDIHKGNSVLIEKMIPAADLIIINGEGTFHRSPDSTMRMLALCNGKPTVLINTLWENMVLPKKVLDNVDVVWVRETASYHEAIQVFDPKIVTVVPDLLFLSCGVRQADVGFSDSVMVVPRAELSRYPNYFPLQCEATDSDFLARVGWMKSLRLLVTGRFHDVVLASMLSVPFLAVQSNSHKIGSLLDDMGCPEVLLYMLDGWVSKKPAASAGISKATQYASRAPAKIRTEFKKLVEVICAKYAISNPNPE